MKGRIARLKANVAQVAAIDFFGANGREIVDGLLTGLEAALEKEIPMQRETPRTGLDIGDRDSVNGRVWVTRQGVFIDRIASAWLISVSSIPARRSNLFRARAMFPNRAKSDSICSRRNSPTKVIVAPSRS